MIRLRRPSDAMVSDLLARAAASPLTYAEHGATREEVLPAGRYRSGTFVASVGREQPAFDQAVLGLRTWRAHRALGARVFPTDPPLAEGTTIATVFRQGPLWVMTPCRIVYSTNEPGRFGFGYGTLPGHPESGEESFHVDLDGDGNVRFEIRFFARLVDPFARFGAPVAWSLQRRATQRYLDGIRSFVQHSG